MLAKTKKYSITKKGFRPLVFSVCKKATAFSCVAGLMIITNLPLVSAYEAHTVNITAKIVNDIPGINPPGGEFCSTGEFKVKLSVNLDNADIYYTTNGDNPVCGGNIYSGPFELPDSDTLVKAVACHEELRNGHPVTLQSAVMAKKFNISTPIVNVVIDDYEYRNSKNIPIWYCNSTYRVNWEIGNYRQDSTADIVYIVDKDNNEVISAGDDIHLIDQGLPTEEMGNYLFKVDSSKGYCYTGYAWIKIIVTEPNGCGDFSVSEIIYEPMPPINNSCDGPVLDNIPAVSPDINIDFESNNPVAVDGNENEEENIDNNTDSDDDIVADGNINLGSNIDSENIDNDTIDKNTSDIDTDNNTDETNEDIKNESIDKNININNDNSGDEKDGINNEEESDRENKEIVIDREDYDEENDEKNDEKNNSDDNIIENDNTENTFNDTAEEDKKNDNNSEESDDNNITSDDVNPDDDISNDRNDERIDERIDNNSDSDSNDNDSPDNDAPIESDDDSTEIGFSL